MALCHGKKLGQDSPALCHSALPSRPMRPLSPSLILGLMLAIDCQII